MKYLVDAGEADWLQRTLDLLRTAGFAAVTGVLDPGFLGEARERMYAAQRAVLEDIGRERLERAGELGVVRLLCRYEPFFLRCLEVPQLLEIVDATVSPTAILHLQNGFVLPSYDAGNAPRVFQNRYHMDFPRHLNGYLASVNVMFAIDEFRPDNGATLVVPGSHQLEQAPPTGFMDWSSVAADCPAGSLLVFDSTLWHAAGANTSGQDRLAINHQFTRSWIKQQVDYVRALGGATVEGLPERTQQLLGWYTRVVASLDEYYQPPERRLYRGGQG